MTRTCDRCGIKVRSWWKTALHPGCGWYRQFRSEAAKLAERMEQR